MPVEEIALQTSVCLLKILGLSYTASGIILYVALWTRRLVVRRLCPTRPAICLGRKGPTPVPGASVHHPVARVGAVSVRSRKCRVAAPSILKSSTRTQMDGTMRPDFLHGRELGR